MPNYLWAAGVISAAGFKLSSTGRNTWSVTKLATGNYSISWTPAHPLGLYYNVQLTGQGCNVFVRGCGGPLTSTSFQALSYLVGTITLADCIFSFSILAT